MPREIVHWNVLQESIDRLDGALAPATLACLKRQQASAYLGAVAHDSPYYLRFGGDPFEAYSKCLHGTLGNDTFDPLRAIALAITARDPSEREVLWAFLLGMVSHYATDVAYHPMVYYLTGEYYDKDPKKRKRARSMHREFEVYLDSYFSGRRELINGGKIGFSLLALPDSKQAIAEILTEGIVLNEPYLSDEKVVAEWLSSFKYLSELQLLFHSKPVGALAKILRVLTFGKLMPIETLFRLGREKPPPYFSEVIHYQNPVTGEDYDETLEDIFERAVVECVRLFELFEPLVSETTSDVEQVLGQVEGLSLNFGEYRVESKSARHFL